MSDWNFRHPFFMLTDLPGVSWRLSFIIIRNLAMIKNEAEAPCSLELSYPSVKTDGNG